MRFYRVVKTLQDIDACIVLVKYSTFDENDLICKCLNLDDIIKLIIGPVTSNTSVLNVKLVLNMNRKKYN